MTVLKASLAGAIALAAIQLCALSISRGFVGRGAVLAYGSMATETLLPALRANAQDGLGWLVTGIDVVPASWRPLAVVAAYCVAYTPLFLVVPLHIATIRRYVAVDVVLAGTTVLALFVALFVIDPRIVWQIAGHLHYLIPMLAVCAAARVIGRRRPWSTALVGGLAGVLVLACVVGVAGSRRFSFWATWRFDDGALFATLDRVRQDTPEDAVLLTHGMSPLADEYIAMLTRRSIFASPSFAYPESYADWPARQRMLADVDRLWPRVERLSREGVPAFTSSRPLVILGRAPGGGAPEGATCIGQYCFWSPAS